MSTYDFDIEHIKGSDNIVADGFSRYQAYEGFFDVINVLLEESVQSYPKLSQQAYERIRTAHNKQVGHRGVDATVARLSQQGYSWPHMRRDVINFIRRCPFCQKTSERKN
jgi:hypothetical protein